MAIKLGVHVFNGSLTLWPSVGEELDAFLVEQQTLWQTTAAARIMRYLEQKQATRVVLS